jgi:hypothetical protein
LRPRLSPSLLDPALITGRSPAINHRAVSHPAGAFGAVTPFGAAGDNRMPESRASALRECNESANKGYPEKDSGMRLSMYRACMAQHGQPE